MITLDILPTYHGTAPEYLGQYNLCSCVHVYVAGPEGVKKLALDISNRNMSKETPPPRFN